MNWVRGILCVVLAGFLATGTTGCIKKLLLNGQIKGTRQGSAAVNTLHDFEVAKAAARAGLAQLEGMHKLAPDNTDALFMLNRGWSGMTFGFTEDEMEEAIDKGDDVMAEYHRQRARAGYLRAKLYGIELVGHRAEGFEKAMKNVDTMKAWLEENYTDPELAEELLWLGHAWISHVAISSDVPEIVADLWVGVELLRRVVELDDTVMYGTAHTILGAYHARSAMAELDESKKHLDRAEEIHGGKLLSTKLILATRYYCAKSDKKMWEKLLHEILDAGDPLPEQRLPNAITQRRARRYLNGNRAWTQNCGF